MLPEKRWRKGKVPLYDGEVWERRENKAEENAEEKRESGELAGWQALVS